MAVPPPVGPYAAGPWHRRYWGYYDRPRAGCGCLYTLLVVMLIWAVFSLLITPLPFWYW